MDQSTANLLAVVLRPLALLFLLGCVLLPVRFAVKRFMPEGKLKRFLLLPIGDAQRSPGRHSRP